MAVFNEDNTTEQMILSTLIRNGWTYIPPEQLDRGYGGINGSISFNSAELRNRR